MIMFIFMLMVVFVFVFVMMMSVCKKIYTCAGIYYMQTVNSVCNILNKALHTGTIDYKAVRFFNISHIVSRKLKIVQTANLNLSHTINLNTFNAINDIKSHYIDRVERG